MAGRLPHPDDARKRPRPCRALGDTYFVQSLTYPSLGLYLRGEADGLCDSFGMAGPD